MPFVAMDVLDRMIERGWGDVPRTQIPPNWMHLDPPDPEDEEATVCRRRENPNRAERLADHAEAMRRRASREKLAVRRSLLAKARLVRWA